VCCFLLLLWHGDETGSARHGPNCILKLPCCRGGLDVARPLRYVDPDSPGLVYLAAVCGGARALPECVSEGPLIPLG
jgi:hypothetical protein